MNKLIRKLNKINGYEIHIPIKYLLFVIFISIVGAIFIAFLWGFFGLLIFINPALGIIGIILMWITTYWNDFIDKLFKFIK